jgi:hypothetical protein
MKDSGRKCERPRKKNLAVLSALAVLVLALPFFALVPDGESAPKNLPTARPDNCAACHGTQKVLTGDHPAVKGMKYGDCAGCHQKASPQQLEGKLPASHIHQLSGVTCAKCHKSIRKPEPVAMKQCVTCHDPDKLMEKTAQVKPSNPHTSPHYGTTLDCNVCHHQHAKSENFCLQCHKFDFVVP